MTLTMTQVQWRNLTLAPKSAGLSAYYLRDLTGWEETPPSSFDNVDRFPIGSLLTPIRAGRRTVTISGWCASQDSRDALLAQMRSSSALMTGEVGTEPLTVTHGGLTLSADAQLTQWQATPDVGWGTGYFSWALQWTCADPLRYGGWSTTQSFLALPGTGLALPTTLPATIPANPIGGLFNVTNDGNASAPAIYTLTGPLSAPGVLLNGGTSRQVLVQYDFALSDSDSLVINTSDGGAGYLNGVYRAPIAGSGLTSDLVLRPGDNSVQALGVASVGDPGSSITVTFRPAYW